MSLAEQIAAQVDPGVRQRGDRYAKQGRVRIVERSEDRLEARVRGTMTYRVVVRCEGGRMSATCTCPYASGDMDLCKHIWATLRVADVTGGLGAGGGAQGVEPGLRPSTPEHGRYPQAAAREEARLTPAVALRWDQAFGQVTQTSDGLSTQHGSWTPGQVSEAASLRFLLRPPAQASGPLEIVIEKLKRRAGGAERWWPAPIDDALLDQKLSAEHRLALATLLGCAHRGPWGAATRLRPSAPLVPLIVPLLCRTGACWLWRGQDSAPALLTWDEGPPWEIRLEVRPDEGGAGWEMRGALHREGATIDVAAPELVARGGVVVHEGRAAALRDGDAFSWIAILRAQGPLRIPAGEEDALLERLYSVPGLPPLDLPPALRVEEIRRAPRPVLRVDPPVGGELEARVAFEYGELLVGEEDIAPRVLDAPRRQLVVRDRAAEAEALAQLARLGFQRPDDAEAAGWALPETRLPAAVPALLGAGWTVEAGGKRVRAGRFAALKVQSGIDWLDLDGTFDFDGHAAPARDVLAALRRGERTLRLDDGTLGVLPEAWLEQYGPLARLAAAAPGDAEAAPGEGRPALRLARQHAPLLAAAIGDSAEIAADRRFARVRERLRSFTRIEPAPTPRGFRGELRPYQREGLAWLHFLRRFDLHGCLADDMGLGKTVQVLALLLSRAGRGRARRGPSLVVAPRSLLFNWREEAARFAPALRVLDHSGPERLLPGDHFDDHDLILTTYGVLRHDADLLAERRFDYVVLDEAQAIKNAASATAQAARRLQADHRLALSGTPIENHLGELWSLFDFLSPGLLEPLAALGLDGRRPLDDAARALLARALRPYILRRTKAQVAPELPDRQEETLLCEMGREQRTFYERLRRHYQRTLLAAVRQQGLRRSQIQVLEALLRLRQAACHPGLVDPERADAESVKLDAALERVVALIEEGHKALIFSQFTALLALLRARLDEAGIAYEYLDGGTSAARREAAVARFQRDLHEDRGRERGAKGRGEKGCSLFLISLRAGGTGLNLTAADYVFLLDPWWNPAAEAQAIDRAHRIGQRRPVIAYRLICKGTIEEKILALQASKRALAESILQADAGLLRTLTAEDLELLLS